MHDDLRIAVVDEMVVHLFLQDGFKVVEIDQLAIEAEAEPLPHPPVFPLKRLGARPVVRAAGCIAGMADPP